MKFLGTREGERPESILTDRSTWYRPNIQRITLPYSEIRSDPNKKPEQRRLDDLEYLEKKKEDRARPLPK
jgi:hypothetical protein